MKRTLIIFLAVFGFSPIFSQQVLPLDTPKSGYSTGDYFKDLNNELDQYVGTWTGNFDGKTLYLQLRKVKDKSMTGNDGRYYYSDQIVGERKIVSSNGTVEVDRITTGQQEFYGIFGQMKNFSQKYLLFQPKDMCNKTAKINITFLDAAKTQMKLHLEYNPLGVMESCQYYNHIIVNGGDWPINFPKDVILTKQ